MGFLPDEKYRVCIPNIIQEMIFKERVAVLLCQTCKTLCGQISKFFNVKAEGIMK
jgi:hypothetical protein